MGELSFGVVEIEVGVAQFDGDATFWEWRSRFNTPPGRESELTGLVGTQVYEAGFESIRQRLERPERPADQDQMSAGRAP